MDCVFFNPVDLNGGDFEYSQASCTDASLELIQSTSSPASFYLDKRITYGDVVVFWFLAIFWFTAVALMLFNYFWKKND